MALHMNTTDGYKSPKQAFVKIDGVWTPVKKVFLNQTKLELKQSEQTELQLSITKRVMSNTIQELETKATTIPLSFDEQTKLNTLKQTIKIVETEQVELSKQINIVKTEQIFTRSIVTGSQLIVDLQNIAKTSEISYRVIEISQVTPTLENIDLVFMKNTDYYFYGRYYRIVDIRSLTLETELLLITNRLGSGTFTSAIRNVKDTLTILSQYIGDAGKTAEEKIDTIQKQHAYVETKIQEIVSVATSNPEVMDQNILKNSSISSTGSGEILVDPSNIDPTKKVGDILLRMYNIDSITNMNVNSATTLQYNADISKQKEIIETVNNNITKLQNATTAENSNIDDIATLAQNIFIKEVVTVDPVTHVSTTVTTNELATFYDMNLSANITTAPAGQITITKVYGNPKPIIKSIINKTIFEDNTFTFSYNTFDLEDGFVVSFGATAQTGSVIINQVNKTIKYFPAPDFNGTDIITLSATDNENETTLYYIPVTITAVNDAPRYIDVAFNANGIEETVFTAPFSVSDLEDSNVPITSITATSTLGVCEIIQDPETGITSVVLTPYKNAFGSGTITIKATDSEGLFTNKILTIKLAGTQDTPTMAVISDKTINEDVRINLGLGLDLFDMAYGSNGSLSLSRVFGFSDPDKTSVAFSYTSTAGSSIIVTGYDVNGRRYVYYIPKLNFFGTDTLTITGTDPDGNTVIGTFNVYVNSVNDPATIDMDTFKTINEDNQAEIIFAITDIDTNLSDFTYVIESITDNTGIATISYNETTLTRYITYIPPVNFFGKSNIVLKVIDTTDNSIILKNIRIVVNAIDDAPVVTVLSETTINEDGQAIISFELFDIDTISHNILCTVDVGDVNLDSSTKIITYTPPLNYNGVANIILSVSDLTTTITKNILVNISSINDIPTLEFEYTKVNNNGTAIIKLNMNDYDNDTISIINLVATNGIVTYDSINKMINYTPNDNYIGQETISFSFTDNIIETPIERSFTFNTINSVEKFIVPYMLGIVTPELIDYFINLDLLNDPNDNGSLIENIIWHI